MAGKRTERIPAEELTAYERWELPFVGSDSEYESHRARPASVEPEESIEEVEVKPLTAADLEQIRLEAYQAGFEEGFNDGQAKGLESGREEGRQQGRQEGLAQGVEEGRQQGASEKQAEVDDMLSRLDGLSNQLHEPIKQHQDEIEAALLNLVLAISRAVIKRELETDSQQISRVVREALASLPSTRNNVRIYVNPKDRQMLVDLTHSLEYPAQLVADEQVMVGGCRVETLHSVVDHSNEKRFQKVVQQMLDRHTQAMPPEDVTDLTDSMGEMSSFHRDLLDQPQPVNETESELESEPEPESEPQDQPDERLAGNSDDSGSA